MIRSGRETPRRLRPRSSVFEAETGAHRLSVTCSANRVMVCVYHRWSGQLVRYFSLPKHDVAELRREEQEEILMSFLRKVAAEEKRQPGNRLADSKDILKDMPAMAEHLTSGTFPDGTERQGSTLLIFCEDGFWKAMINDREAGMTLWTTAESFYDLLQAVEERLQDPKAEWRRPRPQGSKRR